jgi:uncharacterized membrane protein YsdA (DUF1294 family)
MADRLGIASFLLVAVNLITICAFWLDKQKAIARDRRMSEANLLFLAMIGGSPGALYARHKSRHKTRKQPFSTVLLLLCAVQIGAVIGVAIL